MNQQAEYSNDHEDMDVYMAEAFGRKFVFMYPNYLDGIGCICAGRGDDGTLDFYVNSDDCDGEDTWDESGGYHYVGDEDVMIAEGVPRNSQDENPEFMFLSIPSDDVVLTLLFDSEK